MPPKQRRVVTPEVLPVCAGGVCKPAVPDDSSNIEYALVVVAGAIPIFILSMIAAFVLYYALLVSTALVVDSNTTAWADTLLMHVFFFWSDFAKKEPKTIFVAALFFSIVFSLTGSIVIVEFVPKRVQRKLTQWVSQ